MCQSDLTEVSKVRDYLYLGSCRSAANFPHLEEEGITHILNTAHGMLDRYARNWELNPAKFDYLLIDLVDKSSQSISEWFEPSYNWIEKALSESKPERPTKILVHCVQGKSRSVTIAIAYMMRKEGISVEEALNQIRDIRDVVHTPNKGFMKQLYQFEKELGIGGAKKDNNRPDVYRKHTIDNTKMSMETMELKGLISKRSSLGGGGIISTTSLDSQTQPRTPPNLEQKYGASSDNNSDTDSATIQQQPSSSSRGGGGGGTTSQQKDVKSSGQRRNLKLRIGKQQQHRCSDNSSGLSSPNLREVGGGRGTSRGDSRLSLGGVVSPTRFAEQGVIPESPQETELSPQHMQQGEGRNSRENDKLKREGIAVV